MSVTAPCCHKQVRSQVDRHIATSPSSDISGLSSAGNGLTELLQHGIFRERESEMVTDSIRALLLEKCGYTTTVFEFVGGEHTAKNVMIAAVKRPQANINMIGDNLAIAKNLLEVIQAKDKANKEKRKKKFQSLKINEFGDVDEDSYKEDKEEKEEEKEQEKEESKEDKEKLILEVADMVDTNNKIARMEEIAKENAITTRIETLMKTFGIKNMKLFDLVYGDDNTRKAKKSQNSLESGLENSFHDIDLESGSMVPQGEKIKKQLKLRKFLK